MGVDKAVNFTVAIFEEANIELIVDNVSSNNIRDPVDLQTVKA